MEVLRVYDPDRSPPSWSDIIRPGQFVAFSKLSDSGASCDAEGHPFASPSDATCLVFDSLNDARGFCADRIARITSICFEIFDSAGRRNPPLLVMVHPSREHTLATNPRALRVRSYVAIALILAALPLMWFDYWTARGALVLPTFLGISMIVAGLRLLFLNMGTREAERARAERLARYLDKS